MKNLICVMLVVFLPLTLASETQHRFKVYVGVGGDDETINSLISSHLKRELRALGDVNIVGYNDDWEYMIIVSYIEIETNGGVKTGDLSIASITAKRLENFVFKDDFRNIKAHYPGTLSAAHWPRDNLQEWCISRVGSFNDNYLERARRLNSSFDDIFENLKNKGKE